MVAVNEKSAQGRKIGAGGIAGPCLTLSHEAPRRYEKANEFTDKIFASFFRSVRKTQVASRASVIQYLARRRGDREEIPESGETPDPHNLCEPPLPLR